MAIENEGPGAERAPGRWRRIAWFVGLYLAGLVSVAAVSYGLRLLIV